MEDGGADIIHRAADSVPLPLLERYYTVNVARHLPDDKAGVRALIRADRPADA